MASLPALLAASLATGRRGIPRISGREALQLAALAATELVAFKPLRLGEPLARARSIQRDWRSLAIQQE
jgi:hypothetical protein